MTTRTWVVAAAILVGIALSQASGTQPAQEELRMETLSGRTLRWTFVDGPTAGVTFEHTFDPDGSVVWRALDGAFAGASRREKPYGAARIDDRIWVVSYRAESGHTLTVVLDFDTHRATGFASNDETWHQLGGTFQVVD